MPDLTLALGPCVVKQGSREWETRVSAWIAPGGAITINIESPADAMADMTVSVPSYSVPDALLKKRAARLAAA